MSPTDNEKISFANTIYTIAREKEITELDAILWYCNETGLEVEVAATLISAKLKECIEANAEDLHYLKPTKGIV